ncbi:MAG: hypothetical protein ABEJ58_05935 [Halodesulfurarchaeum sp.]
MTPVRPQSRGPQSRGFLTHALLRGIVSFVIVLVGSIGVRSLFLDPVSISVLLRTVGIAVLAGFVVTGLFYWFGTR